MKGETEKPRPVTLKVKLIVGAIIALVKGICATLRITEVGREEMEAAIRENGGAILVTWHGRTMVPLWRVQNRGFWALISLSKDGDLQAENFRRLGYNIVRGSTGRRGAAATREILKAIEAGGVLAFTPDGPRGPAKVAQEGAIYFAKKNGQAHYRRRGSGESGETDALVGFLSRSQAVRAGRAGLERASLDRPWTSRANSLARGLARRSTPSRRKRSRCCALDKKTSAGNNTRIRWVGCRGALRGVNQTGIFAGEEESAR